MAHLIVAIPLIFAAGLTAPEESREQRGADALTIAIQVDKDESGTPIIRRDGEFEVLLTNRSGNAVRLWREDSRLGHGTLSFHLEDSDEQRWIMHQRPQDPSFWSGEAARTIIVPPGEGVSRKVAPSGFLGGDREWQGVPEPNTGKAVRLTAVFEIEATDGARKSGVWTGRAISDSVKVLFVQPGLRTPHKYLWEGCPNQALRIMKAEPAWIHKQDKDECTPLHHAGRFNFLEVARWLLMHGADVDARATTSSRHSILRTRPRWSDCFWNTTPKSTQSVPPGLCSRKLPRATPTPRRIRIEPTSAGGAPSPESCWMAELSTTCSLLVTWRRRASSGARGNGQTTLQQHAMSMAAQYGYAKIVKVLLEHGADPEDADYGGLTVSYFAIERPDILKLLFDAGADPKVLVDYRGSGLGPQKSSLLHEAADKGATDSVKLLLDRGLDVNRRNAGGCTALHVAAWNGDVDLARVLLRHGADVTARDGSGKTPLDHVDLGSGSREMAELLRQHARKR